MFGLIFVVEREECMRMCWTGSAAWIKVPCIGSQVFSGSGSGSGSDSARLVVVAVAVAHTTANNRNGMAYTKTRNWCGVRPHNDKMLIAEHSEHLGAATRHFYLHSTTRSAHPHALLPLNNKIKTKHRLLTDKLGFNTHHIRQGVRTGVEP